MQSHRERPARRRWSKRVGHTVRILLERRRAAVPSDPPEPAARNRRRKAAPESPPQRPSAALRQRVVVAWQKAMNRGWRLARRCRPMALAAGRVLALALFVAGVVALVRLIDRHVRSSPAFALSEATVEGNERLSDEEVLEVAGLQIGANVFDSSPQEVKARLEGHPWVMRAVAERRLPGSFVIQLREHEAVAVVVMDGTDDSSGAMYLLGEDGTLFKRVSPNDTVDLPVVTGIDAARLSADEVWRESVLLGIVALFHDYRGAGLWRRSPIAEVHVEADDGLSLYVDEDPVYVRLGRGPFREKLHRLRRVFDRLTAEKTPPAYVFLDNVRRPDRVTVRLRPVPEPIVGADPAADSAG